MAVFNRLRAGSWWRAPFVASVMGSVLDTAIFFTIAFSASLSFIAPGVDVGWANEVLPLLGRGPAAPLWMSLATADFLVKFAIAVFALAPFRAALGYYAQRRLRLRLRFRRGLARLGQPKPAKGGDPMSSETLEREAGFTRRGTA